MSAFRPVVGDRAKHELLHTSRHGAGDKSTASDVAGDGEEDQRVASGRDPGHRRPAYAALAGAVGGVRILGLEAMTIPFCAVIDSAGASPSPMRLENPYDQCIDQLTQNCAQFTLEASQDDHY